MSTLILLGAPLLLAACGALLSETVGRLNIAVEGHINLGAFVGYIAAAGSGSPLIGMVSALTAGCLLGFLQGRATSRSGANPFLVALGINLLIAGAVPIAGDLFFDAPGILRLPGFPQSAGSLLLPVSTGLLLLTPPLLSLLLYQSRTGTVLRALGSSPQTVAAAGWDRGLLTDLAIAGSSALPALAGALLAFRLGSVAQGLAAGRGWVALVLVYLGFRRPLAILGATAVYALAELSSIRLQAGSAAPGTLAGLPSLLIMALLVLVLALRRALGSANR